MYNGKRQKMYIPEFKIDIINASYYTKRKSSMLKY